MTKSEALVKWCPMVRVAAIQGQLGKEYLISTRDDSRDNECIADNCACWVWEHKYPLNQPETWTGRCGLVHR